MGAKDRKEICHKLYRIIRWLALIDYFCQKPITWEKRTDLLDDFDPLNFQEDTNIPLHIRLSFPKWIIERLHKNYSLEEIQKICLTSNEQAPVVIRVNTLKISREALYARWKDTYGVKLTPLSTEGLIFPKKINFFTLPEFKEGFFEIQDEGSQVISQKISVHPKDLILDFCAGAGGKSLALAPKMQKQGQIYLHDIRLSALTQAKKRLKRAGIQNAQIITTEKLFLLKEKINWLILDVPCSGSGTWRRNPDMKWKLQPSMIDNLIQEQRKIFAKAFTYLKNKGKIAYITCSIFPEENVAANKLFS